MFSPADRYQIFSRQKNLPAVPYGKRLRLLPSIASLVVVQTLLSSGLADAAVTYDTIPAHHLRCLHLNNTIQRFVGKGNYPTHPHKFIQLLAHQRPFEALAPLIRGDSSYPVLVHQRANAAETAPSVQYYKRGAEPWLDTWPGTWFFDAAQWIVEASSASRPKTIHFPFGTVYPIHQGERFAVGTVGHIEHKNRRWSVEASASSADGPLGRRTHRFHRLLPGTFAATAPMFGITLSHILTEEERLHYATPTQTLSVFTALDWADNTATAPAHLQIQIGKGPMLDQLIDGQRPDILSDAFWDPVWQHLTPLWSVLSKSKSNPAVKNAGSVLFTRLAGPAVDRKTVMTTALHLAIYNSKGRLTRDIAPDGLSSDVSAYFKTTGRELTTSKYPALEHRLNYHFLNGDLLDQALRDRSWVNEFGEPGMADNERMEFLGDAVLKAAVVHTLLNRNRTASASDLTGTATNIVQGGNLGEIGKTLNLSKLMYLGRGAETQGQRYKQGTLENMVEALIAALFLDGNDTTARSVLMDFIDPSVAYALDLLKRGDQKDATTVLMEYATSEQLRVRFPRLDVSGEEHNRRFTYGVTISGRRIAQGKPKPSSGQAKQSAAEAAIKYLGLRDLSKKKE